MFTTTALSQKAVSVYLQNKQILPFDFARMLLKDKRQYSKQILYFNFARTALQSRKAVSAYM